MRSVAITANGAIPGLESRILDLRHDLGIWLLDQATEVHGGRPRLPGADRRERPAGGRSRKL